HRIAAAVGWTVCTVAAAGEVAAPNSLPLDASVVRMDCIHRAVYDAGGLGAAGSSRPHIEGAAAEGDDADHPEPGDGAGGAVAGAAGDLWGAEPDAHDPGAGDGGVDGGVSGLHPGVLRLVCADGEDRDSGGGLGGDQRRGGRGGGDRAI